MAGKIDIPKLLENPSLVRDEFYEISGRRDIVLDEVVWVSKYRWGSLARSWLQMLIIFLFHVGQIFVWSTSLGSDECSWLEVGFI